MNKNIKIFPMTSDDLNKIKDELIKNLEVKINDMVIHGVIIGKTLERYPNLHGSILYFSR